jgi:hypothetical protein
VRRVDEDVVADAKRALGSDASNDPRLADLYIVVTKFLDQEDGYVEAVQALLQDVADGKYAALRGQSWWTLVNDLSFMAWGIGQEDAYFELSDLALGERPRHPVTLLTRALWHAANEAYAAALDLVDAVPEDANVHAAQDAQSWSMYMPTFLARDEDHPAQTDIRSVDDIDALRRVYRIVLGALQNGRPVAASIDQAADVPGWGLLVGAQFAQYAGDYGLADKLRLDAAAIS